MPNKWSIYLLGTVEEGSSKTGFWIKISPKWLLHIMSHMDITWSENLFWIYILSNKKYAMKTSWTTIMSRGDKIHIIHQGGPNYGAHIISSPFKSVSWCFGIKKLHKNCNKSLNWIFPSMFCLFLSRGEKSNNFDVTIARNIFKSSWHSKMASNTSQRHPKNQFLSRNTGTVESVCIGQIITKSSLLLQKGLSALILNRSPNLPPVSISGSM